MNVTFYTKLPCRSWNHRRTVITWSEITGFAILCGSKRFFSHRLHVQRPRPLKLRKRRATFEACWSRCLLYRLCVFHRLFALMMSGLWFVLLFFCGRLRKVWSRYDQDGNQVLSVFASEVSAIKACSSQARVGHSFHSEGRYPNKRAIESPKQKLRDQIKVENWIPVPLTHLLWILTVEFKDPIWNTCSLQNGNLRRSQAAKKAPSWPHFARKTLAIESLDIFNIFYP